MKLTKLLDKEPSIHAVLTRLLYAVQAAASGSDPKAFSPELAVVLFLEQVERRVDKGEGSVILDNINKLCGFEAAEKES